MNELRALPSVDELARSLGPQPFPHTLVIAEARRILDEVRSLLKSGQPAPFDLRAELQQRLTALSTRSLRPVINATGVILHTNLGRAPLANFKPISGYSNLEYDLNTGKRGKRDVHLAGLLQALLQRDAIVVNNNASAVFLVLHELAAGHEVIVSRGELIEIGDGFRIPEIMARSGAVVREVGTTNRTHISDYANAINDRTRLILRVHPSNFHISGFTAQPALSELTQLGQERAVPVYEDLGSGCLVDLTRYGVREPLVRDSIAAGVNLVSFSCDKLLGGPQSGIIAGDPELIARVRRNPMYRTFRLDKLVTEALQHTLALLIQQDWRAIPTLQMICQEIEAVQQRAELVAEHLPGAVVRAAESVIGGGSTPDQSLPTWIVEISSKNPARFERALRQGRVPVIARIESDRIILDMRTVADHEIPALLEAVTHAAGTAK